ncbi:MAG: Lrp/AsnC family transcriptional regulator [Deltaproteobacteria bacterium]
MKEILEILEKDPRISAEKIAAMLGRNIEEVKAEIKRLEDENIIAGYTTVINWDKTEKETVNALIEVKVTPTRGLGFDKVAARIYNFPEVKALYLMSGSYDFTVLIEGKTMKEVALFVAEKLAPLESVMSTATHFVLKKYKDDGVILHEKIEDDREVITL